MRMGIIQPTEGLDRTKDRVRENFLVWPTILKLGYQFSAFNLDMGWNWYHCLSLESSLLTTILGLLNFHNCVSKFIIKNFFVFICTSSSIYILYKYFINKIFILFLWRTSLITPSRYLWILRDEKGNCRNYFIPQTITIW